MTRNAFLLGFLSVALHATPALATVDSPVVQGLGGAGRGGVPREAIFANPASVAQVSSTYGFYHFEIPTIPDYNAGGRAWSVGMYDGGDKNWKGGFSYSRISKARIFQGHQGYVDRREVRFSTAHELYGGVVGGVAGRLIKNYNDTSDSGAFFEGDLGVLFPLFGDMRGGLTFENALNREDESPQTAGAGVAYSLGYGIDLLADGYRLMSGTKSGRRGWALGGEIGLAGDFVFRAGLFEEAYRALKGWSVGLSWMGPRASFDYALKTAGKSPKEKSHILGVSLAL